VRFARSELFGIEDGRASSAIGRQGLIGELAELVGRFSESGLPACLVLHHREQIPAERVLLMIGKRIANFVDSFLQDFGHGLIIAELRRSEYAARSTATAQMASDKFHRHLADDGARGVIVILHIEGVHPFERRKYLDLGYQFESCSLLLRTRRRQLVGFVSNRHSGLLREYPGCACPLHL